MRLFVFSQDGSSCLHGAVLHGDDTIVKKLIQAGADVNLIDNVSKLQGWKNVVCFLKPFPTRFLLDNRNDEF